MAIFAKGNNAEYSAAPEGLKPAICCDVVDLGMVPSKLYAPSHQIEIRWQLEEIDPTSKKPYMVMRRFGLTLGKKSHLRPFLEGWRGRKFTEEELKGFDVEKLLNVQCQVQIIHNITDGGTYANVQACVPPRKGDKKVTIREYIRVIDRKDGQSGEDEESHENEEEYSPF